MDLTVRGDPNLRCRKRRGLGGAVGVYFVHNKTRRHVLPRRTLRRPMRTVSTMETPLREQRNESPFGTGLEIGEKTLSENGPATTLVVFKTELRRLTHTRGAEQYWIEGDL
jgi:hypothetical protein